MPQKSSHGYLHIGSGLPRSDLKRSTLGKGKHTVIDPAFKRLSLNIKTKLTQAFSNFRFSSQKAHTALDEEIAAGHTYHTLRLDMPFVGIIDAKSKFGLLCKKMAKLLVKNGKVVLLTDFAPNAETKIPGHPDKITNMVHALESAGFTVSFTPTTNSNSLQRSATATKQKRLFGNRQNHYLVIATKK
jgi:hypothetical protein